LLPFLNLKNKSDELLVLVWLMSTLIPDFPHPILYLFGPYGSTKSTQAKMLKSLIDPSRADSLIVNYRSDELVQVLAHHALPFFDNVTLLNQSQSNIFCCAVTGGGYVKRQLYTDSDEVIFSFKRSILMTGINLPSFAPDLLDRVLLVGTKSLPPTQRREEAQLWKEFEVARPRILGGILNSVSRAMKLYRQITPENLSRMADFERWGLAITAALGGDHRQFQRALSQNSRSRLSEVMGSDRVAEAVATFAREERNWTGTATQLLAHLKRRINDGNDDKSWPKNPNHLTRRLRTLQPLLFEMWVSIDFDRGNGEQRTIVITYLKRSSSSSFKRRQRLHVEPKA
jgi:hypothetical protein